MNTHTIVTSFQNLIPLEPYSYEVESVRGNWPVAAFAMSGSFIPMKTDYNITTNLTFCASSGSCNSSDLLPYSPEQCSTDNIPYIELRVKLDLPRSDQKLYSPIQRFECEECLHQHKLVSLNRTENEIGGSFTISADLTDLVIGRPYSYSFESLGGNYPLCLSGASGAFISESSSYSIEKEAKFVCPSGLCHDIVFHNTYDALLDQDNSLQHKLKLNTIDSCSNIVKYKELVLQYNKINPTFSLPSDITLLNDSKGCTKLNISLNNCLKDHTYTYEYKVKESNWPVYIANISGVVTNTTGSTDIGTNIAFCPSSALCSGLTTLGEKAAILSNKINNYCANNNDHKYISLYIDVTPSCYPENVVFSSELVTVYCNNCIASTVVSFSE
jgi:hypothetical protein